MPLPDIVTDTLRRYMQRHALSPDSVLFPTEAGIPFNATALNRFMHKYARRTGLSAGGVHIFVGRSLSRMLNRFAGVCAASCLNSGEGRLYFARPKRAADRQKMSPGRRERKDRQKAKEKGNRIYRFPFRGSAPMAELSLALSQAHR